MPKWHYRTECVFFNTAEKKWVAVSSNEEGIDKILQNYGDLGWELVSAALESWNTTGVHPGLSGGLSYRLFFKAPADQ